ncbi:conserved hypothetical protein [Ricinus communis]|uniref:Uncharacterized protein n=1 Tax=Ricinus communis TaxID=3988 RepID=B9SWR0_RICCO|nr:conserved hypothetical protein [Ricinus communis]
MGVTEKAFVSGWHPLRCEGGLLWTTIHRHRSGDLNSTNQVMTSGQSLGVPTRTLDPSKSYMSGTHVPKKINQNSPRAIVCFPPRGPIMITIWKISTFHGMVAIILSPSKTEIVFGHSN